MQVGMGKLDVLLLVQVAHSPCTFHSLQRHQRPVGSLTSSRVWLIWLSVVYKKQVKQLVYFSRINFARNDFYSSKFGFCSFYRHCRRLSWCYAEELPQPALGGSGSLKIGRMCRHLYIFFCNYTLFKGCVLALFKNICLFIPVLSSISTSQINSHLM